MVQLYFLSILFNGIVGFLFIFGDSKENSVTEEVNRFSLVNDGFRLILGILAAVTGFLKLLAPMKTLILGDLIPALAGLIGGFILIYDFYQNRSSKDNDTNDASSYRGVFDSFGDILSHHKKTAGIVLLVVAVLHFLFPRALFL